jgi:hypothetical protein
MFSPRDAERTQSAKITAELEIIPRDGEIGRVEWRVSGVTVAVNVSTTSSRSRGKLDRLRADRDHRDR